jgi:hypothetical protein
MIDIITENASFAIFLLSVLVLNFLIHCIAVYTNTLPEDYYDPKRWRAFYIFLLKKHLRYLDGSEIYLSREELIQYGYRFAKCYKCIINGYCIECGCHAEGRFNGRSDTCSANRWGIFIDKKDLDEYLLNPNLNFEINVKEQFDEEQE